MCTFCIIMTTLSANTGHFTPQGSPGPSTPRCCFEYRISPHKTLYAHVTNSYGSAARTLSLVASAAKRCSTLSERDRLRLSSGGLLKGRYHHHVSIRVLCAPTRITTQQAVENLKHSTVRHSAVCCTAGTRRAEQTHPKDRSIKDSVERRRRRLLWFSSGLICSSRMHFCGS